MLKISNLEPVLELAQLRDNIQEVARKLLARVQEPAEAWGLLDKMYGDKHVTILSAMHKLQSVVLPHGPAHNKVEASVLAVRTTRICLKNVNAERQHSRENVPWLPNIRQSKTQASTWG